MASPLFSLRYFLPETRLRIVTHVHKVVRSRGTESRLEPVVDVTVTPRVQADRTARCLTSIDAGVLEKLSMKVTLDDDGMIRSLNSESGRDPAPILSLAGRVLGTIAGAVVPGASVRSLTADDTAPRDSEGRAKKDEDDEERLPLETQWSTKNPQLSQLMVALSARIGALLDQLAKAEDPSEIAAVGQALAVVHQELATIDRARREWISSRARTIERVDVDVPLEAIHRVDAATLPSVLDGGTMAGGAEKLEQLGVLVAVADPDRPPRNPQLTLDQEDELLFRRARPVEIGVYEKVKGTWRVRPDLTLRIDVVDPHSTVDRVDLDGRWLRSRKVDLAFHPDMSISTYGVSSTSTVSSVVTGVGSILDPVDAALKKHAAAPSDAERALADRKLELDTLETTDEIARLSRLRGRSVELAELEQRAAILKARTALGESAAG